MLKKFLALFLILIIVPLSVSAEVSVKSLDVDNDLVEVSASAFIGERVNIIITNPDYTLSQALAGEAGAIQYFGSYMPETEDFSFPVQITGDNAGEFNVYILSQDGEDTGSFVFYNSVFKKNCLDRINSAGENENITSDFENLVKSYGIESNEIYKKLGSEKCASAFLTIKNQLPGNKLPENIGDVLNLINDAFVLAAFNASDEELCFKDSKLCYTDILGISESNELVDYYKSIDSDAVATFNKTLLEGKYESIDDIAARFKELVYINIMINHNRQGYGHIHGFFTKYEDAYESAGFVIPSTENETIYCQFLDLEADNLKDLAQKFNKLEDTEPDPGSGSVGGGNFSVGGGTSYITPEAGDTGEQEQLQESKGSVFMDVSKDFWAYDAIKTLSQRNWVNGYEDGSFRPDDKITRAEYVKLIASVFGITPGGNADFSDVSRDAWYYPYVAVASERGIITGYGTEFKPDEKISRQDVAVILCRVLNVNSDGDILLNDADGISQYAYSSVSYLINTGIINGYPDGTFRAGDPISRAEVAKIIYMFIQKGGIEV